MKGEPHASTVRRLSAGALVLLMLRLRRMHRRKPRNHLVDVYHTYASLTIDVNAWADDHPDIVDLVSAGETVREGPPCGPDLGLGRRYEARWDGKEVVYIDGGASRQ